MSDKDSGGTGERRPFASYTSTDHARVELAAKLWSLASTCHQALIPEDAAGEGWPDAGIRVAEGIMSAAREIMDAAVISAYESGLTWEQIGRALGPQGQGGGISRQSAHAKYAGAVGEFHEQLIAALDRAERDEKPVDYSSGPWPRRITDTAKYAPLIDTVATADYPGLLAPAPKKPGEFTASLSDPADAVSAQIGGWVRDPDTRPLGCRYSRPLDEPLDDGMHGWIVCTLREGHRGKHQLGVRTEEWE